MTKMSGYAKKVDVPEGHEKCGTCWNFGTTYCPKKVMSQDPEDLCPYWDSMPDYAKKEK